MVGRLHFMDGTPTTATFEMELDEPRVLHWIGLPALAEGQVQWLDLAAIAVDAAVPARPRVAAFHS
jgi:hypothetical protein